MFAQGLKIWIGVNMLSSHVWNISSLCTLITIMWLNHLHLQYSDHNFKKSLSTSPFRLLSVINWRSLTPPIVVWWCGVHDLGPIVSPNYGGGPFGCWIAPTRGVYNWIRSNWILTQRKYHNITSKMNNFKNWRTMNGINVGSPINRGHPHATHKYVNILC